MIASKDYSLAFLITFFGIINAYAEPPIVKVESGNGQGNALNFIQFEHLLLSIQDLRLVAARMIYGLVW